MSGFAPGDEVICIDDSGKELRPRFESLPNRGSHYTVRDVLLDEIRLTEIVNPRHWYDVHGVKMYTEVAFRTVRFRPVHRQAVEDFKRMAAGISGKRLADVEG